MDLLPNQLDICIQLDGQLECTEHFCHRVNHFHKDLHIGVDCKLCYLDIRNHCHILQFWLNRKNKYSKSDHEKYPISNLITINLLGEQLEYGSPVVPGGHEHVALWLVTEHLADELQGLLVVQGFTQLLETQAWNEGHSSSEEHPASIEAA